MTTSHKGFKPSWVWKYFSDVPSIDETKRAECSLCLKTLSITSGNVSNLGRHLKAKHPQLVKEQIQSDDSDGSDELNAATDAIIDNSTINEGNTGAPEIKIFNVIEKEGQGYVIEEVVESSQPEEVEENNSQQTNSTKPSRKRSLIWKYFSIEANQLKGKCLVCKKFIAKPLNSNSNLRRHIKIKHPKLYATKFLSQESLSDDNEKHGANEEDQDLENYIPESRLSKSRRSSIYWNYFDQPGGKNNDVKCKICQKSLSYGTGNISNMRRHIKLRHPRVLVKGDSEPTNDSDNSEDFDVFNLSLHMEVDNGDDYSVGITGPVNMIENSPNSRYNKTMGKKITVAACTLNQLALDFEGNLNRIVQSISVAKQNFATYRSGPELEISGYSCEDHFFESDTHLHCWQVLVELLKNPICQGIMIDVGMPVRHRTAVYNCRIVFLDKKIILIRPKLLMCDDGNYRESRWFTPWRKLQEVEDYYLPHIVTKVTGQERVPFGDAVIATLDTCIGYEICEELWNPQSSHIPMSLDGVELILNSSGSYMELRKANIVDDLITSATFKCGGCYVFSNLRGCDGQRTFFNGGSMIAVNGNIMAKGEQFSLKEVEVTCATIDLEDIRSYRSTRRSLCSLSNSSKSYKRINVNYSLASKVLVASPAIQVQGHSPEEEIAYGPACWLWDYLRRSGQGGFFLPLSGGVDSSSTACIVYAMCHMIYNSDDNQVLADVRKMVGNPNFTPQSPRDICNVLFVTCYIGTENSSLETKERAINLARQIGSYHLSFNMDAIVQTMISVFTLVTGKTPKFRVNGGTERESLALQNIQARLRMVLSYFFAQLMLWVRGRQGGLLVLGSANVDESLRGYLTKYDCSSADVNPIGGISKKDLKLFLQYMSLNFELNSLDSILVAPPTAELEPLQDLQIVQTDEVDMGMTYDELNTFGVLRKTHNCGPYSMFCKLVPQWNGDYTTEEVAEKVKHFFRCYAINRHKMSVLTPSIHVESYSPDDNRFDHRQFLYNVRWPWQFRAIDNAVKDIARTKGVSV